MMAQLNLPPFDVRLQGSPGQFRIFDMLRQRYVALTPEEWVRQHFVHYLTDSLGYPKALLANEVELRVGDKRMRADSVLYDRRLRPRMILEYKAPSVAITQRVFNQVSTYNMLLHVGWLVVSNGISHYCCRVDSSNRSYSFLDHIPTYQEIDSNA